jgi:hypothetical protein
MWQNQFNIQRLLTGIDGAKDVFNILAILPTAAMMMAKFAALKPGYFIYHQDTSKTNILSANKRGGWLKN